MICLLSGDVVMQDDFMIIVCECNDNTLVGFCTSFPGERADLFVDFAMCGINVEM
jgi:hypothetical protein